MTVRRPLKLNGTDLKEMSDSDISNIQSRMISLYGQNPSVTLSVVSSGGNLGELRDRRLAAGSAVNEGEAIDPVYVKTVIYSRISQSVDSSAAAYPDTDNIAYPVYLDGSNNIKSMTDSDFYDTFVEPAITSLTSSSTGTDQAGTYFVSSSSSVSNASLVSLIPVFTDTTADAEAFASGPLPEDSDQPITINNYYLHQINSSSASSVNALSIDSDYNIREYNDSDFDNILQRSVRYAASNLAYNKIRYSYFTGNQRGTAMLDTILDSDNSIIREGDAGEYDYARQEVPAGESTVYETYYLRINKEV